MKTNRAKLIISSVLMMICFISAVYFHVYLEKDDVFTHFFYIPVILTSMWWGYWGFVTAGALGASLIISNHLGGSISYTNDMIRIFFFFAAAYLTGYMSFLEREAKKKLIGSETIMKVQSDVIHLITHKFRNPMAAIKCHLDLINRTDNLKDIQISVNALKEVTERSISVLDDFLFLEQLQRGDVKFTPAPTDLSGIAYKVTGGFNDLVKEKNLEVIFEKELIPEINTDAAIVERIFGHLFVNAVKYTPERGTIKIKLLKEKEGVLFQISDSGVGIPRAEHGKVFDLFYVGSNIENTGLGSGIGLHICKKLVEICGGSIRFESDAKEGTTFFVYFPFSK